MPVNLIFVQGRELGYRISYPTRAIVAAARHLIELGAQYAGDHAETAGLLYRTGEEGGGIHLISACD